MLPPKFLAPRGRRRGAAKSHANTPKQSRLGSLNWGGKPSCMAALYSIQPIHYTALEYSPIRRSCRTYQTTANYKRYLLHGRLHSSVCNA